ncbi:MAG: DUF6115 domain-containing protein [Clostridiales bacterium]|nr:DUF6115 domain-containing protein [Clostridiales bacterium]
MTVSVIIMIIIGLVFIFISYFISESLTKKEENFNADLLTVNDNYEFSEREMRIIKNKIEDVIAQQAKDILYETNESLANMANEKTLALGDYAVTVCDEIERNHKEVMFLYSMLDDKQKEIMKTVQAVDKTKQEIRESVMNIQVSQEQKKEAVSEYGTTKKQSAIDQLTALKQLKEQADKDNLANSEKDLEVDHTHVLKQKQEEKHISAKMTEDEEDIEISLDKDVSADMEKSQISHKDNEKNEDIILSDKEDLSEYEDVFDEIDKTDLDDALEDEFEKSNNSNDIILQMHRNGDSIIDIARELGLGVGEVKLVIDLYQGV